MGTKSTPGGAVIKVKIPDDPNLKGVCATYERNGETVEARISRYLDTLVVEGLADEEEHEVKVRSFNSDNVMSEAQTLKFVPQPAPVHTVDFTVDRTFGGITITLVNNKSLAQLAVVVQADTAYIDQELTYEERQWKDVTTLFTSADSIALKRRGMSAIPTVFAIHLRDDWGNVSATKLVTITPLDEVQLTQSKFKYYNPGDDNFEIDPNGGPITALWDGSGSSVSSKPYKFFAAKDNPLPQWITIDLGQEAILSRIKVLPRQSYMIYQVGHVREYEFWGSYEDPKNGTPDDGTDSSRHGFNSSWFCLGKFEQPKPSGYLPDGSVGVITSEDVEYANYNTEFEMDPTSGYPDAWNKLRYLRVVVVSTFNTYENKLDHGAFFIGDIMPYGQVN